MLKQLNTFVQNICNIMGLFLSVCKYCRYPSIRLGLILVNIAILLLLMLLLVLFQVLILLLLMLIMMLLMMLLELF